MSKNVPEQSINWPPVGYSIFYIKGYQFYLHKTFKPNKNYIGEFISEFGKV
jgi:hypothetical protein